MMTSLSSNSEAARKCGYANPCTLPKLRNEIECGFWFMSGWVMYGCLYPYAENFHYGWNILFFDKLCYLYVWRSSLTFALVSYVAKRVVSMTLTHGNDMRETQIFFLCLCVCVFVYLLSLLRNRITKCYKAINLPSKIKLDTFLWMYAYSIYWSLVF